MKYRDNIEEILNVEPDYLGFIFYEKSPRNVGDSVKPEYVRFIRTVDKIGVFVNAPDDFILEKVEDFGLTGIQLHGEESPGQCDFLRLQGVKVIKVFSVGKKSFDFTELEPYVGKVDYFLFDTKGKHPGGNGVVFDWDILNGYKYDVPFFLSGGISLESLDKLKNFSHPMLHAIDVNSQFESEPGRKILPKLRTLKEMI